MADIIHGKNITSNETWNWKDNHFVISYSAASTYTGGYITITGCTVTIAQPVSEEDRSSKQVQEIKFIDYCSIRGKYTSSSPNYNLLAEATKDYKILFREDPVTHPKPMGASNEVKHAWGSFRSVFQSDTYGKAYLKYCEVQNCYAIFAGATSTISNAKSLAEFCTFRTCGTLLASGGPVGNTGLYVEFKGCKFLDCSMMYTSYKVLTRFERCDWLPGWTTSPTVTCSYLVNGALIEFYYLRVSGAKASFLMKGYDDGVLPKTGKLILDNCYFHDINPGNYLIQAGVGNAKVGLVSPVPIITIEVTDCVIYRIFPYYNLFENYSWTSGTLYSANVLNLLNNDIVGISQSLFYQQYSDKGAISSEEDYIHAASMNYYRRKDTDNSKDYTYASTWGNVDESGPLDVYVTQSGNNPPSWYKTSGVTSWASSNYPGELSIISPGKKLSRQATDGPNKPLTISAITSLRTENSVAFTWTTGILSISRIDYGKVSGVYTKQKIQNNDWSCQDGGTVDPNDPNFSGYVTSHSMTIDDLDYGQTYYFKIFGEDPCGRVEDFVYNITSGKWERKEFSSDEISVEIPAIIPEIVSVYPNSVIDLPLKKVALTVTAKKLEGNNSLKYDWYFGSSNPPVLVLEDSDNAYYLLPDLSLGETYYWKVVLKDQMGSTVTSSIYSFSTVTSISPVIVSFYPTNALTDFPKSKGSLSVTARKIDGSLALLYDWYFGTENPPPLVEGDSENAYYQLPDLTGSTVYYWKVTVKDQLGGVVTSSIYSFTTEADEASVQTGEDEMNIDANTNCKIRVRLTSSLGVPVTGVSRLNITALYLQKYGGSPAEKTLTLDTEFVEIDSTNFPGEYDLQLYDTETNVVGPLRWSLATSLIVGKINVGTVNVILPAEVVDVLNVLNTNSLTMRQQVYQKTPTWIWIRVNGVDNSPAPKTLDPETLTCRILRANNTSSVKTPFDDSYFRASPSSVFEGFFQVLLTSTDLSSLGMSMVQLTGITINEAKCECEVISRR